MTIQKQTADSREEIEVPETATLTMGNQTHELAIVEGTENEQALDIRDLRTRTGLVTLDAGYGMKFHQVAPHIVRTGHIRTVNMFCINEEKFKNLPAEYQQILREVAKKGDTYYMKLIEQKEDEVIAKLKEEGATISTIDVSPLQEKLIPVAQAQESQGSWSEGLYEYIRTLK